MTFGITFSINFPDRLNLVICNKSDAKTSFLPFQASQFSIKNRSKNHVFFKPFLGPPFSHFFLIFFKSCRFWDPLRNPTGAKMAPKSTKWRHNGTQTSKVHSSFFGPDLLMHFVLHFAHLCNAFGTLGLPFASLLVLFSMFVNAFGTDL